MGPGYREACGLDGVKFSLVVRAMWMRISGWCQDPRREPLEKAGERACPLEADRAGLESGSASLALGTQVLHLNDANMLHGPGDKMHPVVTTKHYYDAPNGQAVSNPNSQPRITGGQ